MTTQTQSRPTTVAGIVLVGGDSRRMGSPKHALPWGETTLLATVVGALRAAGLQPLLVVRAPGQDVEIGAAELAGIELVDDLAPGQGPLEGLRAGLAALAGRAGAAYASATDAPFLHPTFVRRVVAGLGDGAAAAVPSMDARMHPLAAAYRVEVAAVASELLAAGERRLGALLDAVAVAVLDRDMLLADAALARADPELCSLVNVNDARTYDRARRQAGRRGDPR